MDVDPPELYFVEVNGNLIFDRSRNNTFTAHIIWVNQGKIWAGSAAIPFNKTVTILLKGSAADPPFYLNNAVTARKMLLVTGGL